jgi:hypothetical protein
MNCSASVGEDLVILAPTGAIIMMAESQSQDMARQPEEPSQEQVLSAMMTCESYTVKDFKKMFDDTSRWTLQRRLNALVDVGEVNKKEHGETRVTYWVEPDG